VEVVIALIALAAVALVVMGAVVITDMLVRRDLAKKVVPVMGNEPAIPLTYKIWQELKPDLEKAAPSAIAAFEHAVANGHAKEINETIKIQAN